MELLTRNSVCCVVSLTPKGDEGLNEDAATTLGEAESSFHGVAVADGLGSYSHGGQAARMVIQQTAALASTLELTTVESLRELFRQVRQGLRDHIRSLPAPSLSAEGSYGTTLIVAVETPNQLIVAYVGNGAIWHLRGNFDESMTPIGIPWSSANYLQPHSLLIDGKECLYNLIAFAERFDDPPAVIAIDKHEKFGDILCVCTDGIYSADRIRHGTDVKGEPWISAEASMPLFYECLGSYFSRQPDAQALEECWRAYLQGLKDRRLLEDDASLGIILTREACSYQESRRRPAAAG